MSHRHLRCAMGTFVEAFCCYDCYTAWSSDTVFSTMTVIPQQLLCKKLCGHVCEKWRMQ